MGPILCRKKSREIQPVVLLKRDLLELSKDRYCLLVALTIGAHESVSCGEAVVSALAMVVAGALVVDGGIDP